MVQLIKPGGLGRLGGAKSSFSTPRQDLTAYVIGDMVSFAGHNHRCVFPGTSAASEPTIIAPIGASELVINGIFDGSTTGWTEGGSLIPTYVADGLNMENGITAPSSVNQQVTVINGASYLSSRKHKNGVAVGKFSIDSTLFTSAGDLVNVVDNDIAITTKNVLLTAIGVDLFVSAFCNSVTLGANTIYDDISIIQVTLDGTAAWETTG